MRSSLSSQRSETDEQFGNPIEIIGKVMKWDGFEEHANVWIERFLGSITYPVAQANSSPTTNIHIGRLYTRKPRKEAVQAHFLKLTSAWRSRALYTFP